MSNLNKVMLIGRVGRDPEMRYMPSGAALCNLSLATSRSWKNKDSGEKQEETEWHRIAMFDRLAEIAGEYVKKGSLIYIEGRLRTRKWQDKDGKDNYTTEIVAEQMNMLGGKADSAGGGAPAPAPAPRAAAPRPAPRPAPAPAPKSQGFDDMDDDIPF